MALLLDDLGGKPSHRLLGAAMEAGRFLRLVLNEPSRHPGALNSHARKARPLDGATPKGCGPSLGGRLGG
jgi:hypothetical protein